MKILGSSDNWEEHSNCPYIPGLYGMIHYPPTNNTSAHAFYIEDGRLTALEAYEWCEANAKGEWKVRRGIPGTPVFVTFWDEQDAMLFKLSW